MTEVPSWSHTVSQEKLSRLNENTTRTGEYVLYWMQASQRAEYNHALEYAVASANKLRKPLIVFFGITDSFPEANERHYLFMLEGLREVEASLRRRGIGMVVWQGSPELGAVELSKDASLAITDRGYLRIQRRWRSSVAENIEPPLVQVESDVVVPVETASPKEEYSAATLRLKLRRVLRRFLVPMRQNRPRTTSLDFDFGGLDLTDPRKTLAKLRIDRGVEPAPDLRGGTQEAKKHLQIFITKRLDGYARLRNDPTEDALSNMSPYLHFGQISPLYVVLRVSKADGGGKESFLEELIVRRELSMNFAFYNERYDSIEALPQWASRTLAKHQKDRRPYVYTMRELERATTHDPYWNAAQREMVIRGKMHGYMRMYWGKKILEWSETPEDAYKAALYLNNRYELDGRDPNGFAGVAWCLGKHDRPWKERPVFGKVRYMNAEGLRRKFRADKYVKSISDFASKLHGVNQS